jgi:septal ring factor EnvC (AmiA/AmiB activator)
MQHPQDAAPPPADRSGRLEQALLRVEAPLQALQQALLAGDLPAMEAQSHELHMQLARTVDVFMRSGRDAPLPAALRHRLATAGARIGALRDTVARARSSTGQALAVLLPTEAAPAGTYSARGVQAPRPAGGFAQA